MSGNDTLNIKDFHFFDNDEGILLGRRNGNVNRPNRAYVLRTTDGGMTWDTIQTYTDTVLLNLDFPSQTVGYISAVYPSSPVATIEIFKSTDGGLSWIELPNNGIDQTHMVHTMHFYDEEVGIVSRSGYSWITYDGGDSWDSLNNIGSENLIIHDTFILLADGNGYGVSYDTLNTYSIGSIFENGSINSCDLSISNGDTTLIVAALGGPGSEFDYPFTNYGMIGIGEFHTEQYDFYHFPEHRIRIVKFTDGEIYVGCTDLFGNERHILKSEDGGNTWWTQEIINLNEAAWLGIENIQCLDSDTCIAGDGYSLYKTANGGGPLLEQVGHQVFLGTDENVKQPYNLSIYPNPTTNQISISANQIIQEINIVDLNGRLVYSESTNGLNTTIQVGTLSTGVYVVHVKTKEGSIRRKIVKQ